jgi:hypothetical protein
LFLEVGEGSPSMNPTLISNQGSGPLNFHFEFIYLVPDQTTHEVVCGAPLSEFGGDSGIRTHGRLTAFAFQEQRNKPDSATSPDFN